MDSASPASPKEETAQELANGLVELLSLERSSDDRFVGQAQPGGVGRVSCFEPEAAQQPPSSALTYPVACR